jgi:hypothetical protein
LAEYAQKRKNLYRKPVTEPGAAKFKIDHAGKIEDEPIQSPPESHPIDVSS